MGRGGTRQRKRGAPECEEAETRRVAYQYNMRELGECYDLWPRIYDCGALMFLGNYL